MEKDPKDMNLGEIIDMMVRMRINLHIGLDSLDGQGSDYNSEQSIRQGIIADFHKEYDPLLAQLSRRELFRYSK